MMMGGGSEDFSQAVRLLKRAAEQSETGESDEEKRDAVRDAMRDAYNAYETYAMGKFTLIMMLMAIRMTPCFVYSHRVRRAPAADQTR